MLQILSFHLSFILFLVCVSTSAYAEKKLCEEITYKEFLAKAADWKGKNLVAFASWCSSCKSNITDARKNPQSYILIAAFDEKDAAERVLAKWNIEAPCFFGDDLVSGLGIPSLPWSKKI